MGLITKVRDEIFATTGRKDEDAKETGGGDGGDLRGCWAGCGWWFRGFAFSVFRCVSKSGWSN
jgi:hypothetical protein